MMPSFLCSVGRTASTPTPSPNPTPSYTPHQGGPQGALKGAPSGGRRADDEGLWRTADGEKFLLLFSNTQN